MAMGKGRVEAFSDGVIAIIITIMVLEMKAPHAADWESLRPLVPVAISYVLSYIYVGIYWNNHHHLFQAVEKVEGKTLWANLHLLFWMSLIPFVTSWMGESHFGVWPVAAYGGILFMCAVAWQVLAAVLLREHGKDSALACAIGAGGLWKGWRSAALYVVGVVLALFGGKWGGWGAYAACGLYFVVAALWFIPDRRIEQTLKSRGQAGNE
ncbi:MAG: TMEM175 family protein [Phycisphaerales bacterium]